MNDPRFCTSMLFVFFLVAAVSASAAAEVELNLQACAAEGDDRRRLACYDAEVARLRRGAAETSARQPENTGEAPPQRSRAQGKSDTVSDEFGMTPALARSMKGKEEGSKEPDSIAAVITRIDEKPYGERILYLDNGQVWEENSRNRNLPLAVGDEIAVKSAAFGAYKLIGPGGKRFTRVRRIG